MDTPVMAGAFITFHHRGLLWNWPNAYLLFAKATSHLVKQVEMISLTDDLRRSSDAGELATQLPHLTQFQHNVFALKVDAQATDL